MVKWYNTSLPRMSREFDSPCPHKNKKNAPKGAFSVIFVDGQGESKAGAGIQDDRSECLSARRGSGKSPSGDLSVTDSLPV